MSYATCDDFIRRFTPNETIALTDFNRTGKVNREVLQVALDDATAEINGYLVKYSKPFDKVPPILIIYCCDIARYRMTGDDRIEGNPIEKRYAQAIDYLTRVAKGQITLIADEEGTPAETDSVVIFSDPQKVFGRDNPY